MTTLTTQTAEKNEITRLRTRVRQHELTVERLAAAVTVLRRGAEALRNENRELRLELELARKARADRSG